MLSYTIPRNQHESFRFAERLCCHHDHLKTLVQTYGYMRKNETYDRMLDLNFRCSDLEMANIENSNFTSLIIKLSNQEGNKFFSNLENLYQSLGDLIQKYDDQAIVESYLESAHITIKSLIGRTKQSEEDLKVYSPFVRPIVKKWIDRLTSETKLYSVGLFTNLHRAKGLTIGLRFFPSSTLIQNIRGEVGVALYDAANSNKINAKTYLQPEKDFHTMLVHSSGLRVRNMSFPLNPLFIMEFVRIIEKYDREVFVIISDIELSDIFLRNGKSDKLLVYEHEEKVGAEIVL